MPWTAPSLSLRYGPYFKADIDDQKKVIEACRTAIGGGAAGGEPMVSRESILKLLAPIFGIDNVAAAMKALDKEQGEKASKDLEKTKAEQTSLHALMGHGAGSPNEEGNRGAAAGQRQGPPGR